MPKVAAALLALAVAPAAARGDGEVGPMFGGSIVATHGDDTDVAGVGAEVAVWFRRVGLAAEATRQWSVDAAAGPQVGAVAGSVRFLAFDHIVRSLFDAREVVDLGLELHGILERAWWTDLSGPSDSYGLGVALRIRGASDNDRSRLLVESRVFVRVLTTHGSDTMALAARDPSRSSATSGIGLVIGVGALFGGGEQAYVERLRRPHGR